MHCQGAQEEPERRPAHFWQNSMFEGHPKTESGGAEATKNSNALDTLEFSLSLSTIPHFGTISLSAIHCRTSLLYGFMLRKAWGISLRPKPPLWLRKAQILGFLLRPRVGAESAPPALYVPSLT